MTDPVQSSPPSTREPGVQRLLVVGSGGRENALAWALARCPGVERVWVAPGNGGTAQLEGCEALAIHDADQEGLLQATLDLGVTLVVVGPEGPLADGLADTLRAGGIAVFGPGADGAQLEASKQWAKALMLEAGVPTAGYWAASSREEALAVLEREGRPLVVKADGLAAGKGVTVAESVEETRAAIEQIFAGRFGEAGQSLVLEERLSGPEVSVFALSDGRAMVLLPPAQDHKRIGEGDTGPNTGGMGAYAPAPLLDAAALEQVRAQVLEPTLNALRRRGIDYRGVIYAGLMLSEDGIRVIEFNCRFGDPECQTLMPLLGGELAAVLLACARGALDEAPTLSIAPGCSACVVAAAAGYPGDVRRGDAIHTGQVAIPGRQLFHAGSRQEESGACVTAGGRVLAVVAQAGNFDAAFASAYDGLAQVRYEGITFRRDIGHQVRRT
ncbi:phosphoribosylamine--glycine ligase [Synechococcus sp. BSF8S]|uniref:phosphoribosylamine--glycine ligase n=1 Tax=Synechococcales TaxID=1890424 RepID=UPI00162945D3|nr:MULTISPECIES: phosphoribosylamine--glycine ligase [unclassified Synechococcus]MBC1260637.1 phosphoribosylamine--glycine ligase [Synechococcus sp. BSF8S]MBC1263287.1 phosphoribosylamine--glycine ligase [Synechococcus sp. BSA11S]